MGSEIRTLKLAMNKLKYCYRTSYNALVILIVFKTLGFEDVV